jgi:asparagine synthase (glutamine-hydrolysing)
MGVFLSGGIDSTVIAALMRAHVGSPQSFAVGVQNGLDLEAARFAARALDTVHYECSYSLTDVDRELERIIYHLESYDPALVRSAVPCYFLSKLAADHVKVVLTGEGADELFGGYAYFADIQEAHDVHRECVRLLFGLHAMNLQRVDRMTMAHGLEGRVPFLDVEFVDWAMSLDPELKRRRPGLLEKQLLRKAASELIPREIAERPKLEFSHGSGGDALLRDYAEMRVADGDLARASRRYAVDPPTNKEELLLLYRMVFDGLFPGKAAQRAVARWRPAVKSLGTAFREDGAP